VRDLVGQRNLAQSMTPRLLSQPPRAVIWDLDGTLLDTEPLYTEAVQAVVGRYGKTYDWSLKRRIVGGDARVGAALVIRELGIPLGVDEYLRERDVVLHELFKNTPAAPGVVSLVRALHGIGVPLAIATSANRALTELKLARHDWVGCFSAIVCAGDPGIARAKPAPDLFLAAARALGVAPEQCLVLEDAPNGVAAARAAGMDVIAIVDPHMCGADYTGALACLDSLEQLTPASLGF
jgi:pseudouridine-5'-monophosphatase